MPTCPSNQLRVWIEPKVEGGRSCSLCWAGTPILSCPWTSVRLVLWCSDSDQDLHHWPPGSQAFRLGLNYSTNFPRSPACRWLSVGLFGLHNQWGNSNLKKSFLSIYLSYWFCFSRVRWLIQIRVFILHIQYTYSNILIVIFSMYIHNLH